jgi:hypothetical protein
MKASRLATHRIAVRCRLWGHLRRLGDVHATSGFPPLTAEKRTFRFGRVPSSIAEPTDEPSFTLVLVQSGCIPKAIESVLNPPADVLAA